MCFTTNTSGGDGETKEKGGLPRYARKDEKRKLNKKSLGNVLLSSQAMPMMQAGVTTDVKNIGRLPRFARNDEKGI